jgi:hypothetical protein
MLVAIAIAVVGGVLVLVGEEITIRVLMAMCGIPGVHRSLPRETHTYETHGPASGFPSG